MKSKVLLIFLLCLVIFTGCGKMKPEDKLFYAIDNNNLQGVREVLADTPELDFERLNHHEFTTFREEDQRALSFALDGCADETLILELLSSGRINANNDDEMTYLTYAICNGFSLQIAEALVDNGADVNAGEKTCLESFLEFVYPGMSGAKERMDFLVEHGAIIDEKLLSAVEKNDYKYIYIPEVIQLLRQENAKISEERKCLVAAAIGDEKTLLQIAKESPEQISKTELILAAGSCSVVTLQRLEEIGYKFDISDENKWTPLHIAALRNNKNVVEYFVEKRGLNLNEKATIFNLTPLDMAAVGNNQIVLKYLLEHDCNFGQVWNNACEEETGKTVEFLMDEGYELTRGDWYYALVSSTDAVFKNVMEKEIPMDFTYDDGVPIEDVQTEERLIALLQKGASVTENTLYHAVELRAYDAMDIILKSGRKIGQDEALIEAVSMGDLQAVKKLVDNGADMNHLVETSEGKYSAMHVASWGMSKDILEYLIDHGGDYTIKDDNGKTPYEWAKETGLKENIELME